MKTTFHKRPTSTLAAFITSISAITTTRIFKLFMKICGRLELSSSITFDPHTTYLILSNHQSRLDPFAFYAAHSLQSNFASAPVRFLTAKSIYYSFLYLWLKSMGCYPTKNRQLTVPETVSYLTRGYSVFIFPEGRRTSRAESSPREGAKLMLDAIHTESLPIKVVLVHIEWEKFRLFRKAIIRVSEAPADIYQKDIHEIMDMIYAL